VIITNRQSINRTIAEYLENYNPKMIGIFGSYACEQDGENSDIDILVRFKKTISLTDLVKIQRELSNSPRKLL
jgi:hypothetical protein